ncbi:MAG: hypothetical protein P1P89_18615 [Desulfobacterales bacterium]|nr:hypothetical protein [Desulfobacterales bacterium]
MGRKRTCTPQDTPHVTMDVTTDVTMEVDVSPKSVGIWTGHGSLKRGLKVL